MKAPYPLRWSAAAMSDAWYNEHAAYPAQWLRNLVAAGEIAPGVVDERSIADVCGPDLEGRTQAHFFAGIGGWSYALRLAGWPDGRPVWTGSAPCQPFSCAGKGRGAEDPRHLWPQFRRLIAECRPPVIFGEQVGGPAGRQWLAGVRTDLEELGYAVGAADLCAAGVGAPHRRQRVFFVADATGRGFGIDGGAQDAGHPYEREPSDRLGDAKRPRPQGQCRYDTGGAEPGRDAPPAAGLAAAPGFWDDSTIVYCDERAFGRGVLARRVEPGASPLAARLPRSVGPGGARQDRVELVAAKAYRRGTIAGYGNAIVPQLAAQFIRTLMEGRDCG